MRAILLALCCSLISTLSSQGLVTFMHNGITREYNLYVPTSYTAGTPVPLVFALHGTTQTGAGIMDFSDFNSVAEANGFIVAYPSGIGGSWNTGLPGASTADDLGLIDTIATILEQQYTIDPLRIFSCGFSAGGYMSYRLACESPRCFAAVVSVAGTMTEVAYNACAPTFPANVLHIHGTSDLVVNYNGGGLTGKSVDEVLALWNTWNDCNSTPLITALPNIVTLDLSTVEHHDYAPCTQGAVELLKVLGGGHQWPGTSNLLAGLGIINQDIDASEEIWDFFSQHSCLDVNTGSPDFAATPATLTGHCVYGQCAVDWSGAATTYKLFDGRGALMCTGTLTRGRTAIALPGRTSGLFVLRCQQGATLRLVAE
ncbi:MAG TPA: PHB depolymerase family esterase [Flavobacteriales bacterium]|nr:PHB depolymerase family esterase [Flavobacteriales bacterium]